MTARARPRLARDELRAELQVIDGATDDLIDIADALEDKGLYAAAEAMRSLISRIWGSAQCIYDSAGGVR